MKSFWYAEIKDLEEEINWMASKMVAKFEFQSKSLIEFKCSECSESLQQKNTIEKHTTIKHSKTK